MKTVLIRSRNPSEDENNRSEGLKMQYKITKRPKNFNVYKITIRVTGRGITFVAI